MPEARRTTLPPSPLRCRSGFTRREALGGSLAAAVALLRATRIQAGPLALTAPAGSETEVLEVPRLFDGLRIAAEDGARVVVRDGLVVAAGRAADVAAPAGRPRDPPGRHDDGAGID